MSTHLRFTGLLVSLLALGACQSKPAAPPRSPPPDLTALGIRTGDELPLRNIRRAPPDPTPALLATGRVPLYHILGDGGGNIRIINATTAQVLVPKAAAMPNAVISIDTASGIRINQILYVRGPFGPSDRFEIWWIPERPQPPQPAQPPSDQPAVTPNIQ